MKIRKPLANTLRAAAQKLDPKAREKGRRIQSKPSSLMQPQATGFHIQLGELALPAWWHYFPANLLVHGLDILKATGITPNLKPPYWHCRDWAPSWNHAGYYRLNEIPDAIASDDIRLIEDCARVTQLIHSTYQWPFSSDYPSRNAITAVLKDSGYIATMVSASHKYIIANVGAGISG